MSTVSEQQLRDEKGKWMVISLNPPVTPLFYDSVTEARTAWQNSGEVGETVTLVKLPDVVYNMAIQNVAQATLTEVP